MKSTPIRSVRSHRRAAVTFSDRFWKRFARQYWEKRPRLIPRPFRAALISQAEAFKAMLTACQRHRAGNRDANLVFQVEGERVTADPSKFFPRRSDRTLSRYVRRVSRALRGRRFGLIITEIQMDAPKVWFRLREFLAGVEQLEAVPPRAKASIFIGNYRFTPVGLHRGNSSNFKFVIVGRKEMHLWPHKFFRHKKWRNHTHDVAPFLPAATTLEGRPGDVIYWPSDSWHIGTCIGGPAVSISLALYVHERVLRPSRPVDYLNRITSSGFVHVPPPRPPHRLSDGARVRGDPRFPIAWQRVNGSQLICSANGHAFSITAHPNIPEFLRWLNTGAPTAVGTLVRRYAGESRVGRIMFKCSRNDIRGLLEKLYRMRALR